MVRYSGASREWIRDAWGKPKVRAALAKKAAEVRSRAEAIAAAEKVDLDSSVSSGTRPKTRRPFSQVSSPNVGQEFGTATTSRKRILGRAGGG
jgi:hypothetical protein